MSELNLTHSNGNKVKLTTPDTLAANKTFKLPNADGSANSPIITNGSGALSFASLKLPSSDGTAGQVLQTDGNGNLSFVNRFSEGQVVNTQVGQWTTTKTTTSTSLTATGLSVVTQAPESSKNDHVIFLRVADLRKSGDNAIQFTLHKNGTFLQTWGNYIHDTSSSVQQTFSLVGVIYDGADDSGSVTYECYWKSATGATIYANVGNGGSEMVVQEIKRYS